MFTGKIPGVIKKNPIAHGQNLGTSPILMNTKYNTCSFYILWIAVMTCNNYNHDSQQIQKKSPTLKTAVLYNVLGCITEKNKQTNCLWINRLTSGIFFQHSVMLYVHPREVSSFRLRSRQYDSLREMQGFSAESVFAYKEGRSQLCWWCLLEDWVGESGL